MNLVEKAETFARRYHSGQKYGNGLDYCNAHLSKVVGITKGFTENETVHAIAWLHDILEDTNIDQTTLTNEFGAYIAKQVFTLTRFRNDNKTVGEQIYVEKLKAGSRDACIVKMADIIANLSNLETKRGNRAQYAMMKFVEAKICLDVILNTKQAGI